MKMKTDNIEEIQNNLIEIFKNFNLRTDVINTFFVDRYTYKFKDNVSDEQKVDYYRWVCKHKFVRDFFKNGGKHYWFVKTEDNKN